MIRYFNSIAIIAALVLTVAGAQEENSLTRDEVAFIKKKLVGALDALGQPPAGFSTENESFYLPTEAYKGQASGLFRLLNASVNRTYGTQKKAAESKEDLEKEYEKKIAAAQAKGDYQAIVKLAEEMQKKAGEMQLKTVESKKEPISVGIRFNSNPNVGIDPDAVVFERSGVIALKSESEGSPDKVRVSVYFDPVSLKETKQLSKVNLKQPEGGVAKKTTVLSVTIELSGPATEVEQWAKKIDVKKVLAQIDTN